MLCLLIGTAPVPWATLGTFIAATAYLRNAAYLATIRPGMSRRDRLATLFLAPLYGALHLGVLVPLRLWALLTLRRGAWGTRHQIELAYAP